MAKQEWFQGVKPKTKKKQYNCNQILCCGELITKETAKTMRERGEIKINKYFISARKCVNYILCQKLKRKKINVTHNFNY